MNRFLWGASQGLSSALFFLVQLTFLKEDELKLMALFSTLFAFMNFFLLATRRSLVEINSFIDEVPSFGLILQISLIFGTICMPLLIIIYNNPIVMISVVVFLFNQISLDFLRFSSRRNHLVFIAIQLITITITLILKLFNISALNSFVLIVLIQLVFCIFYFKQDKRNKLNNFFSKKIFNFSRLVDFSISSGFGFLLPLLVFLFLDSGSVGELRTSQNFLSLGSIFTASIYYSALNTKSIKEIHWISYFIPSLILLSMLVIIEVFLAPSIVSRLFGPFYYKAIPLTLTLIVALVPIIWNSRESAKLVNAKRYKSLLRVHSISLIVLATGACIGFEIIGVASYGIFVIVSNVVEMTLIRKMKRNLNVA